MAEKGLKEALANRDVRAYLGTVAGGGEVGVGVTVAALSRWETGRAAPRGRNGALFAFLRDRMDAGAEPETLKRLLLIGGALATGGDPPVVLMMAGRLTEEDLMRELTNLFAKEGTKR